MHKCKYGKFTLNKKIIITTALILIIILITTLAIGILSKKQNSTILQAKKTEFDLQENEHMHIELDASGDKVPVPNGYVGSKVTGENEINTGYVIYEGEEEVNDTNKDEAQKSRNQYVWIPVPDISKMYGTDANGKKWGKLYEFTSGTSSDPLFDEVTGTYPNNWSESNGIMEINFQPSDAEPKLTQDRESDLKRFGIGIKTPHEFLNQLEKEFNNMIASIAKYGGFYIGRYETGNVYEETEVTVVQKGNFEIIGYNWYTMYKKCKNLKGKNRNVETGIIWGNQWDRVLMWLIETKNKTKKQIADDSTSWGNYSRVTFEYVNSSGNIVIKNEAQEIPTGSTEYTKANNIYDLAGNVSEVTMGGYNPYRRNKGGNYGDVGDNRKVSNSGITSPEDGDHYYDGCRAMLYIK